MTTAEAGPSLRARQGELVRRAVLDAVVAQLDAMPVDDISMGGVAAAAGISLRTLYRYFPDRPALLHAAGEHLYESLGIPFEIAGPDEVSASFLDAARRLSTRPNLTRALVATNAGRTARSPARAERLKAIRIALRPLTDGVGDDSARRATAVIAHLCSAASWVAICDDSGLDDGDAQQAVAWAIDALIAALRSEQAPSRGRRTARR